MDRSSGEHCPIRMVHQSGDVKAGKYDPIAIGFRIAFDVLASRMALRVPLDGCVDRYLPAGPARRAMKDGSVRCSSNTCNGHLGA